MGAVIDPLTGGRYQFSRGNHRRVAYCRDEISVTGSLQPQYSKAGFQIVKCHSLDEASNDL